MGMIGMHGRDGEKNLESINQLFDKHTKYEGLKKEPSSRSGRVDFPSGQVTVHWARAQASCLSTKARRCQSMVSDNR